METKNILDTPLEYAKGIGPQRAKLLNSEVGLFTFGHLLNYYPFRYEDRSHITPINTLNEDMDGVLICGAISDIKMIGNPPAQRLSAMINDSNGTLELLWFKGAKWMLSKLKNGQQYMAYGKLNWFNNRPSLPHPELEPWHPDSKPAANLTPIYSLTEKMKRAGLDSKTLATAIRNLLVAHHAQIQETLPEHTILDNQLISRAHALIAIHFPKSAEKLEAARQRLKFEELFLLQIQLLLQKNHNKQQFQGFILAPNAISEQFRSQHLPFALTGAQVRVLEEISQDMQAGRQMNRLLQGDVGSGKTIVAFISMLAAIDNGKQACIMAPTEILANQHYQGLMPLAEAMGLQMRCLTGSTKAKERKVLFPALENGEIHIIAGTHALLEDNVKFKSLGVCVIDEQHRFGVAQRARLWGKNADIPPHILVMTATPIPRTLAMTLYGDLDISIIDELPPGRKPISTVHRYDSHRLQVFGFMQQQIDKGFQIYVVYPLIEESETQNYKDLMDGYESVCRAFPQAHISILHGRMKPADKQLEMERFIKKETQIMVATTVIEVGVNVPNASVMVIESAEKFGLSQLHQLRGRVGRGADQSYCILMSSQKLGNDARLRLRTMEQTTNGFEIADVDLKLRGPGDLSGTQQSGIMNLSIADLAKDALIVVQARHYAEKLLGQDAMLEQENNQLIRQTIAALEQNRKGNWSKIS